VLFSGALVLSGCGYPGDHQLTIRNTSSQDWLVRVRTGDTGPGDRHWVTVVHPGADGLAFRWWGSADEPIQLLDEDCSVIGVFEMQTDGLYRVKGVDGVEATITAGGRSLFQRTDPLLEATTQCNGVMDA
jgi:hypothetical protein